MQYVQPLMIGTKNSSSRLSDMLIAASPTVKQPATLPFRVVLYKRDDQYIVHDELFLEDGAAYQTGDYFHGDKEGFVKAFARWSERVARQAKSTESILRERE